jgi:hypothetical protein
MDPDADPDPVIFVSDPDPHPDPLVGGVDPLIRVRIRTKILWIRNTGLRCLVVQVEPCTASSSRHTSPGTAGPSRPL